MRKLEQFLRDIGEFDDRLKAVEKKLEIQPTHQPVATLCDVVDKFLDKNKYKFKADEIFKDMESLDHALAAERKRAVLVGRVIRSLQLVPEKYRSECQNSALAALDAFDKGAENG